MNRPGLLFLLMLFGLGLAHCTPEAVPPADLAANVPTVVPTAALGAQPAQVTPAGALPVTWTPVPLTPASPTAVPYLSPTAQPTATLWPTPTVTPTAASATVTAPPVPAASATPLPTATLPPSPTPVASAGPNLLPNGSFEGGWYHIDGIPELQVAESWRLSWETGENPLDPDPWNAWVRPETRVLTADFLPPSERDLFIRDGRQTVKIFKGQGAISYELTTEVVLPAGRYRFETNVYPDLVVDYAPDGSKIFADDILSGEVRYLVDGGGTGWMLPAFGRWNRLTYDFDVMEARTVRLGLAIRGRWAITNNGWFLDEWSLRRIGDPGG